MEAEALARYPGGDLVAQGISDLESGRQTEESLLVCLASPRLRRLGLILPEPREPRPSYEHALFEALEVRKPQGAHAAYNALIGRIVSFAQAYGQDRSE